MRSATPEVLVSAIGGDAVTIATGTAVGAETTLAGQVFTAAPVKPKYVPARRVRLRSFN